MKMVRLDKYDELQKDFSEYRRLTTDLSNEKDEQINQLRVRLLETNKLVLRQGKMIRDLKSGLTYSDFTFKELISLFFRKVFKK